MSERSTIPLDRLITALEQRRTAIVDVIRHARRRITLSLFRCNDRVIFEELAAATDRGVLVEVLVTSRVKGGRKKIEKLWNALEKTGAVVKAYTDPVVNAEPPVMSGEVVGSLDVDGGAGVLAVGPDAVWFATADGLLGRVDPISMEVQTWDSGAISPGAVVPWWFSFLALAGVGAGVALATQPSPLALPAPEVGRGRPEPARPQSAPEQVRQPV